MMSVSLCVSVYVGPSRVSFDAQCSHCDSAKEPSLQLVELIAARIGGGSRRVEMDTSWLGSIASRHLPPPALAPLLKDHPQTFDDHSLVNRLAHVVNC